ncbi:MAG: pilin [Plesiomonas shigelloides]
MGLGTSTSAITYNITKGSPDASGRTVQLARDSNGWSCSVTGGAVQALLPKGCTASN